VQTEAFGEAAFDTTIIGGGGDMQFTPRAASLPAKSGPSVTAHRCYLHGRALSIWPMQLFSTAVR
jgi:hypothetical protein